MRFLHIAPHYGGGITPAIIGITQVVSGDHLLFQVEETTDRSSIDLLNSHKLQLYSIEILYQLYGRGFEADYVIIHYWETDLWGAIREFPYLMLKSKFILLNHQAFAFNRKQILRIETLFSCKLQSGFVSSNLPQNWFLVPTCRNDATEFSPKISFANSALYFGTLSYKKASRDFFILSNKLIESNIVLDVFGKSRNDEFFSDLLVHEGAHLRYMGFSNNISNKLPEYTFLFYPLKSGHYGTTENVLLEGMSAGLIPIVNANEVESFILGPDLISFSNCQSFFNLDSITSVNDSLTLSGLSAKARYRALELSHPKLRKNIWDIALNISYSSELELKNLGRLIVD